VYRGSPGILEVTGTPTGRMQACRSGLSPFLRTLRPEESRSTGRLVEAGTKESAISRFLIYGETVVRRRTLRNRGAGTDDCRG